MRSDFFFAILVLIIAVMGVRYLESSPRNAGRATMATAGSLSADQDLDDYFRTQGSEVRVQRGSHNQFFVTAAVNRHPASFLVDTGASYVALRESDALASGVFTKISDYTHAVSTANGETRAALVTLSSIEIGELKVDNVKAFILPDDQLGMNLLGMSFLSKLRSVEARNGELVLKG